MVGSLYGMLVLSLRVCVLMIITGTFSHSYVTGAGQMYSWGNNEYGQLGVLSEDQQVSKPVRVEVPNLHTDGHLVSMATGGAFTAFLTGKGLMSLLVN